MLEMEGHSKDTGVAGEWVGGKEVMPEEKGGE